MSTITEPNPLQPSFAAAPSSSEPIAIVSSACRLPGHATNPHKLWRLLCTGGIAASDSVPLSRFDGRVHRGEGFGKASTMVGGTMFIESVDPAAFDAAFFNINRTDAVAMDPSQRQLLEVVYECLENGGITLDRLSGEKIGTFVGSFMNGELSPFLQGLSFPSSICINKRFRQIIKISKPEILEIVPQAHLSAWAVLFSATGSVTSTTSQARGKEAVLGTKLLLLRTWPLTELPACPLTPPVQEA